MKKKGISAIVATVLIILVTVAAITIIWTAIIPMISENIYFDNPEAMLTITEFAGYTFCDPSSSIVSVQVKRGSDDVGMINLAFKVIVEGNSVSYSYDSEGVKWVAPSSNNAKVYRMNLSEHIFGDCSLIDEISVIPVYSKGKKSGISSSYSDIVEATASQEYDDAADDDSVRTRCDVDADCDDGESCVSNSCFSRLVSYWTMDDVLGVTVIDSMGVNNGTAVDDASQTDSGKVGKAFEFDGDGDYVSVGDDNSLDFDASENYTWSAWINPREADFPIFQKYALTHSGYTIHLANSKFCINENMPALPEDLFDLEFCTVKTVNQNVWTHVAVSYSGQTFALYINGSVEATGTTGFDDDTIGAITLGYSRESAEFGLHYSDGSIDEAMIFNRSLSAEEILSLYNSGTLS